MRRTQAVAKPLSPGLVIPDPSLSLIASKMRMVEACHAERSEASVQWPRPFASLRVTDYENSDSALMLICQ